MAIVRGYLPIVDFLIHNSGATDKKTTAGCTPLHYCAIYNRTEPAKLLLRAGVDLQVQDNEKHTALETAKLRDNKGVEELLLHAMEGKKTLFESVDFDWNLGAEDSTDFSDDEPTALDDSNITPEKRRRPSSFPGAHTPGGEGIPMVDPPFSVGNASFAQPTPRRPSVQ